MRGSSNNLPTLPTLQYSTWRWKLERAPLLVPRWWSCYDAIWLHSEMPATAASDTNKRLTMLPAKLEASELLQVGEGNEPLIL